MHSLWEVVWDEEAGEIVPKEFHRVADHAWKTDLGRVYMEFNNV
jgi:hypothetical protein